MLRHAEQWGVVHQNAAALADAPTVVSKEVEILTPAQVKVVLANLRDRTLYPIAAVALGTAPRRIAGLALAGCRFRRAALQVERSLEQTKRGGLVFKAPKTRNGRRRITLPASTHWKAQQEQRLALGLGKAPESALVFSAWDGSTCSPNALTKEWSKAMDAAKITATLHSLRHTHAQHADSVGT